MKAQETTEERFWEMLEVLPPRRQEQNAFLVGEPTDHLGPYVEGLGSEARYNMFSRKGVKFYDHGPMTVSEFNLFIKSLLINCT